MSLKDGIKLSLNISQNNLPCLNILYLGVLYTYFSRNVSEYLAQKSFDSSGKSTIVGRYPYGLGSGPSSVGIALYNFVTYKMSDNIQCMADELYCIIRAITLY